MPWAHGQRHQEPHHEHPRTTQAWQALDAAHHLHPFSDAHSLNQLGSRVVVRGEGVRIWDSEGQCIIDGMAGLWCVNLGYGRKELPRRLTSKCWNCRFTIRFSRPLTRR